MILPPDEGPRPDAPHRSASASRSRIARHLPLRSRVVLATAHSARLGRQSRVDPGRPGRGATRRSRSSSSPAGRRAGLRGRIEALGQAVDRGLLPGHLARLHRRRLLLPDLRHPPAPGHDDHPDLARLRRVQEGRLQPARQVVRRGRGADPAGPDPFELRRLPGRVEGVRAALRRGLPPAARALRVAASGSRARTCSSARSGSPGRATPSAAATGCRTAERVILYAPTFRGDTRHDGPGDRRPRPRPAPRGARRGPRPARPAPPVHPLADGHRAVARRLRHRRLRPPRHQRADARQRRPGDRLLERDLRVRAARPARWSSSRPTTRPTSASAASTSTIAPACPARSSRPPPSLAAYLRAGVFDIDRVERFRDESFDVADGHSATYVTDELILPSLTRAGEGS